MAHVRAVFSDPGIVPLPQSRLDFSDMHAGKCCSKIYCIHLKLGGTLLNFITD